MDNGQKFTADCVKYVELKKQERKLKAELDALKKGILDMLSAAGVSEIARGKYVAKAYSSDMRTLQADKVEAIFGIKLTDDCFKVTPRTMLKVAEI